MVIVSGMKSAINVFGDTWENRWGLELSSCSSGMKSAGQGGRTVRPDGRRCIAATSSSFKENCSCCGSSSLMGDSLFGVDDELVFDRLGVSLALSSGGIGSGQCVVPVTEITSLPSRPNGLARYSSWYVRSLIDWRRLKPVEVDPWDECWVRDSTSDVAADDTVFERDRFDSVGSARVTFVGSTATGIAASSCRQMIVDFPSRNKGGSRATDGTPLSRRTGIRSWSSVLSIVAIARNLFVFVWCARPIQNRHRSIRSSIRHLNESKRERVQARNKDRQHLPRIIVVFYMTE